MFYTGRSVRRTLLSTLCATALASTLGAATIINTVPSWDGSTGVGSFGYPDTATYGQLITVPAVDNVLNSFAFEMNLPRTTNFRGYVFAWNGTQATGSALFTSGSTHTSGSGSFELVTFSTGGISLTPGGSYVIFASTSAEQGSGQGQWGNTQGLDTYTGGQFVYLNNGSNPAGWTGSAWATGYLGNGDLAFQADFSGGNGQVPEPSTWAMMIGGLGGLLAWKRRR